MVTTQCFRKQEHPVTRYPKKIYASENFDYHTFLNKTINVNIKDRNYQYFRDYIKLIFLSCIAPFNFVYVLQIIFIKYKYALYF